MSPPATSGSARTRRGRWARGLGPLFVLGALYFWWRAVEASTTRADLRSTLAIARGHEGWLLAALAAAALYLLCQAVVWRRILADMTLRLPWPMALRAWSVSNLGRYLPGGVWHLVGRVELGRGQGVAWTSGTVGIVLEQGLQLVAALALVAMSLPFWPPESVVRQYAWLAALVPLGLALLHPRVFYPVVDRLLARLRQPPLAVRPSYGRLLGYLGGYAIGHLCNGSAFACAAIALGAPLAMLPAMIGGALFAWTVGFVIVVAPGGLGPREAAVTAALAPYIGADVAALAAALWRVANVLSEVAVAGAAEALARRFRRVAAGDGSR